MSKILEFIFPQEINNNYTASKTPLYVFYFISSVSLVRSLIHILAFDGGAQSIASIPIQDYTNGAQQTVIFMFAIWGLSQLLIALVYLIVIWKYKTLLPLMYILLFVEYTGRVIIGHFKPITTLNTPPGEVGNYIFIPLSLFMLTWLFVSYNTDAKSKI